MAQNYSGFKRVLNGRDVIMVAFGAMIGWGWVVSSGQWIQTGGAIGTAIAFCIGGIMIYLVGLTYAELTTAMPKVGGEQNFSYAAFGAKGSYVCTWALLLSYIGVVCFESCSFATIMQYLIPGFLQGYLWTVAGYDVYLSWVAVAIIASIFIVYINYIGTKRAAKLQNILTCIIAGVGILLVAGSAINGDPANLASQPFVGDNNGSILINIMKVAIMTPFFLFGFDIIPQAAEEINVPLKKLGKLMVLSIGLAAAFNNLALTKVLIIGGLCGIVTTWNSFLIGGSRLMFSMAQSKMLPGRFSILHPEYKTPYKAILFLGVLSMLAPLFGRVMLVWIVDAANFACCLAYFMVAISFLRLRKTKPNLPRPYRVRNGRIIGTLAAFMAGFMAFMYVLPTTSCALVWQEWVIVGGWAIIGVLLAISAKKVYGDKFCSGMEID